MEQSSEEVHQNMIRKRKIFFIMPVIRHYIAIFVTFFFFYKSTIVCLPTGRYYPVIAGNNQLLPTTSRHYRVLPQ